MYSYLRGVYKGQPTEGSGVVLLEAAGIGYEVLVPPAIEQEIAATRKPDDPLLLYVSAHAGRDQPWPVLFGFLRPEEKAFWELLKSVPRVGGKGAARAMAVPVPRIAQAIQDGNKAFLDSLPGVTLEGAEKMIASLRKKVAPFVRPAVAVPGRGPAPTAADEMREDAVAVLTAMGVKRLDAQKAINELLASRDDLLSVQDLITAYFRAHQAVRP
jgi:Holliday junction resolvasome RuvABC DNA-binding subunit